MKIGEEETMNKIISGRIGSISNKRLNASMTLTMRMLMAMGTQTKIYIVIIK